MIGAFLVLLLSPVVLLAALFIDLAQGILPAGFGEGTIRLPTIEVGVNSPTNPLPGILFYVVVGTIIALELAAVALYLWWRWRERREIAALTCRRSTRSGWSSSIGRPDRPRPPRPAAPPRRDRHDPVGAYLLALDALAADGRWARQPSETPRQHSAGCPTGRRVTTRALAGASWLAGSRVPADPVRRHAR